MMIRCLTYSYDNGEDVSDFELKSLSIPREIEHRDR